MLRNEGDMLRNEVDMLQGNGRKVGEPSFSRLTLPLRRESVLVFLSTAVLYCIS